MKTLLSVCALTLAISTCALSQSVVTSASAGKMKNGKVPVTVTIQIPKGYHIYGPKAGSTGISTAIKVKGSDFKVGSVTFPKTKTISVGGEKIEIYESKISIPLTLTPSKKIKGKQKVHLLITSQACNDRTCLPASTIDLPVTVTVSK